MQKPDPALVAYIGRELADAAKTGEARQLLDDVLALARDKSAAVALVSFSNALANCLATWQTDTGAKIAATTAIMESIFSAITDFEPGDKDLH